MCLHIDADIRPRLAGAGYLAFYNSTLQSLVSIMLDSFEIISTSGVVLWSRSYAPVKSSIINGLIRDVFIEEKVLPGASVQDDASAARNPPYKKDQYTLKWTTVKDLGLIFVVRPHVDMRGLQLMNLQRQSINLFFIFLGLISYWTI